MLSRKWGEINDGIETDLETFSQEAGERDGISWNRLKLRIEVNMTTENSCESLQFLMKNWQ